MQRLRLLALSFALIGAVSCKNGKNGDAPKAPGTEGAAPAPSAAVPVGHTGVLEGVVRLAEGYELPSYSPEQMEKKVLAQTERAEMPDACSPPHTTDRQPVLATASGALSNVLLAPSQFSQPIRRANQVHEVSIEDCRLTPKFVAAMKGDLLRVRNTMTYPFMPTYEEGMARTLLPGQTYDVPLDKPGVQSLMCGFTAPCGRTDVVVMLHPVYAVTNAEGKFRFDEFPADESVVLSAWHPLFEETKLPVRLQAGEHKTVELVLTPRAAAKSAAATPAPPPPPAKDTPKAPESVKKSAP